MASLSHRKECRQTGIPWRNRPDQSLLLTSIADRLTGYRDPATQRGLRNDAAAPYTSNQVIFADHAVAVSDEVFEQIKHLRLNRDEVAPPPQLSSVCIQTIVFEPVRQTKTPAAKSEKISIFSGSIKDISKTRILQPIKLLSDPGRKPCTNQH